MPKVTKVGKFRRKAKEDAAVATALKADTTAIPISLQQHDEDNNDISATAITKAETNSKASRETELLSRGQRKRQAKREQYLKREHMILSTLKLKHQEEQKKRLDGLDALKEALMEVATSTSSETVSAAKPELLPPPNLLRSNRSKKELTLREVTHLNLVLQHPAFQANPLEAMQEHLRNSLAAQAKQQSVQAKQREQDDKAKQEVKRQEKKEKLKEVQKHRKKFKAGRTKSKQR